MQTAWHAPELSELHAWQQAGRGLSGAPRSLLHSALHPPPTAPPRPSPSLLAAMGWRAGRRRAKCTSACGQRWRSWPLATCSGWWNLRRPQFLNILLPATPMCCRTSRCALGGSTNWDEAAGARRPDAGCSNERLRAGGGGRQAGGAAQDELPGTNGGPPPARALPSRSPRSYSTFLMP